LARQRANVSLIGSHADYTSVLDAIKTLDAERICLGCESPFALMHACVATYGGLLDGEVTKPEKAEIMGGNTLTLFGFDSQ